MTNRWGALCIIFISFLQFTINWFNVVPCFGGIIGQMHISLPEIGTIIGMFLLGYGLMHIPGGWLNEQIGIHRAMLCGIAIETLGAVLTGLSPDLGVLLIARVICGVGGAIYIGSAIGITAAWFRRHELVTATGIVTGVAFTVGAAIGIFPWHYLVNSYGWRGSQYIGAGIGALTFLLILLAFPVAPAIAEQVEEGHHLSLASLKRVFGNRNLWLIGFTNLGAYGAYFTVVELLPSYAQQHLALKPDAAALLGTIVLLCGIPGSFAGGWLADKLLGGVLTFLGACFCICILVASIPFAGPASLQWIAALIGAIAILGTVGWFALPGLYVHDLKLSDIPTAAGLMLSIAAIGGVAIPPFYGHVATGHGYTAAWESVAVVVFLTACAGVFIQSPRLRQKLWQQRQTLDDAA